MFGPGTPERMSCETDGCFELKRKREESKGKVTMIGRVPLAILLAGIISAPPKKEPK